MASISTTVKREALTQAWAAWIMSATGERPNITYYDDGVDITWKEGQARKMEEYLAAAMAEKEPDPNAANVNVALAPVLLPLALKKSLGYIVAYSAALIIGTKLIWK